MAENPFGAPTENIAAIFNDICLQLTTHFENESLDNEIYKHLQTVYIPLAYWISQQHQHQPVVIGINGALGAGKSTLVQLLAVILEQGFGKKVLCLSIDDLYHSKEKRLLIADKVHPLLATRGVPGTHDVDAGIKLLEQCLSESDGTVEIPVFDKSIDDLKSKDQWLTKQLPLDIILFEGWCVGAKPQADEELLEPVNQLEKEEDPNATWRNYINQCLRTDYQKLFNLIDKLIMMKVPSMEQVMEWRNQQEEKLTESSDTNKHHAELMSKEEIARFILHDERLIQHQLSEMPGRADVLLEIGNDHQVSSFIVR